MWGKGAWSCQPSAQAIREGGADLLRDRIFIAGAPCGLFECAYLCVGNSTCQLLGKAQGAPRTSPRACEL